MDGAEQSPQRSDRSGQLEVCLLGPLTVTRSGSPVRLTARKLRSLLSILALSVGRPVSVDRLSAVVWGTDMPRDARRGIHIYVARLRALLGPDIVSTDPDGYRLAVPAEHIDVALFYRLLATAREGRDGKRALLAEALRLWRGQPFEDVESAWLLQFEAPRLIETYLTAVEERIDLDLAAGRHGDLVGELSELTGRHPLRESLWARMLVVLQRCERPAEALSRYEVIRSRIADDLGVDPGPELQQIYADLLAGRPSAPASGVPASPVARPVPQQLPADLDVFAGRALELKELAAVLHGCRADSGPVVVSLHGSAGVGKTAVAVRWAHQIRDEFPDGQLYVDLRGFDPAGVVAEPGPVVRDFLDALGVPRQQLPGTESAQFALYRSILASKRMLVLLDNARSEEQLRPLLPGGRGCLTVITSRSDLTGLVASGGTHPIAVAPLSLEECRLMLVRRLGADRVTTELEAADDIIRHCGCLPLAIAAVAARAATRPSFALRELADELRRTAGTLNAFPGPDPLTDVRAVFSWSLRALSRDAERLFCLLSVHPGPEAPAEAAASLAGCPVEAVGPLLAELTRVNLLIEPSPDRFVMPALLRAYAHEQTNLRGGREEAIRGLLDHYAVSARNAAKLVGPRSEVAVDPEIAVTAVCFTDRAEALAWLSQEYAALLGMLRLAAAADAADHTWNIALALWEFLERQGRWHDLIVTESAALEAARSLSDRRRQGQVRLALSMVYTRLQRFDEALAEAQAALAVAIELNDPGGQARALCRVAALLDRLGMHDDALGHAHRALDRYRTSGDRAGEAAALTILGQCQAHLGRHERALAHSEQALAIQRDLRDRAEQAASWDAIGDAHRGLGRDREAIACYHRALDLQREFGRLNDQAGTLVRLGDAYAAAEDVGAARTAWELAIAAFGSHPDADDVRSRLAKVGRVEARPSTSDVAHGLRSPWTTPIRQPHAP
jgi:DNA-binding SARP family transcriptional activator/tetratricopeptide (TPR) repeat protein